MGASDNVADGDLAVVLFAQQLGERRNDGSAAFCLAGIPWLCVRVNEQAAKRAGAALVGALTGAVADGLDAVAGRQVLGRAQCGDDGGARGVTSSPATGAGVRAILPAWHRLTTAGTGMGMRPWAQRMVPWPSESDSTTMSSIPRSSRQMATEQTSTMESTAPTSWNMTVSGVLP